MLKMIECMGHRRAEKQQWLFCLYFVLGLIKVSGLPAAAEPVGAEDLDGIEDCTALAVIKVGRFVGDATFIADFFGGEIIARYRQGRTRYYVIGEM